MSVVTDSRTDGGDLFEAADQIWRGSVVSGVVAAAVMAVFLTLITPPVIAGAIPALYGQSGLVAGWLVHLTHGGAFGFLFAGLAVGARSRLQLVGLGMGFGTVLWFVGAGAVMPIWLTSISFPGDIMVPNLEPLILVAHLVYGAVIGGVLPELSDI
jgi:hypothetical protein